MVCFERSCIGGHIGSYVQHTRWEWEFFVATDFVEGRDRKKLEQQATSAPLQKVVEPEDVAKAIIAYITHLKHSTGARIIVDSGKFLK